MLLTLGCALLAMLGAWYGLARVDRHAVPPTLATAALITVAGAYVAALFSH